MIKKNFNNRITDLLTLSKSLFNFKLTFTWFLKIKSKIKFIVKTFLISIVCLFTSILIAIAFIPNLGERLGLFFNFTNSMPKGIYVSTHNFYEHYQLSESVNDFPKKDLLGQLVILCTNELSKAFVRKQQDGFCDNKKMPLLKRIVAIDGDVITINDKGVFVNGIYHFLSKPMSKGVNNEPLPKLSIENQTLTKNQIIVLGDSSNSWDSRYWGIADVSQIVAIVKPLIIL